MDKQQSSKQITPAQKETLVNFVYARPKMQTKTFTPTFTKAVSDALWEQVATILNSMPGGAVKDAQKWNKTWRDIKNNTKNKTSKEKRYSRGTGGGPPLPPPSPDEKSINDKIVEILTPTAIEGNLEVLDPAALEMATEIEILDENEYSHEIDTKTIPSTSHHLADTTQQSKKKGRPTESAKNEEDGTIETPSKKSRYTKSGRLSDSIRNNKTFLTLSENGMNSTEKYRGKKIEILEQHYKEKREYYKQKLEVLREFSISFNSIAVDINSLHEHFE